MGVEKGYKIGFTELKTGSKTFVHMALFKEGNIFTISQPSPLKCQNLECNIFRQIISTFKFTETQLASTQEEVKKEIKPAKKGTGEKLIKRGGLSLGRNDIYRVTYVKMIGSALYLYHQDYGKYPTSLKELLESMIIKTYPYSGGEELLKDPVTKKFYEYHFLSEANDYQLCVDYDIIGQECYSSQDFEF
jgi:hypothetical protein